MILIKCCIHIATNVVSLIFVIQCVGREPTVDCRSQNSQISRFWFGKRRVIDGDDDCGDGDLPLDGSRGACFRKYCLVACTLIAACEKYLNVAYCIVIWCQLYSTVTLRQGEKKHYNHKVDAYSFAIVLWELLHNKLPFEGMSNLQAAYAAAFKVIRFFLWTLFTMSSLWLMEFWFMIDEMLLCCFRM